MGKAHARHCKPKGHKHAKSSVVTKPGEVARHAAELRGAEKSRVLKATSIPLPVLGDEALVRKWSIGREKRFLRNVRYNAELWEKHTPTYRISGAHLDVLSSRPKPSNEGKVEAQSIIDIMRCWESDACSAKFCDEEGKPLAAYFAKRIVRRSVGQRRVGGHAPIYHSGPSTPTVLGRTAADIEAAAAAGQKVINDGLKDDLLEDALFATQVLHHFCHPQKSPKDGRHNFKDFLMRYKRAPEEAAKQCADDEDGQWDFVHDGLTYRYADEHEASERTGVTHLVHAWHMQGHRTAQSPLKPSADMVRNAGVAQAVEWYLAYTRPLALTLKEMFKVSWPEYYEKYRAAFEAGVWVEGDPGPWLGRAIVWKLQVLPHRDGLDGGPTAIFCLGRFSGGECYLPDLGVKLQYRPGDVLIFLSGDLYHAVGNWRAISGVSARGITPGRVGNVFFSPADSLHALKGKPPRWSKKTAGGVLPMSS